MKNREHVRATVATLAALFCLTSAHGAQVTRVLFIGNSLTTVNDVPGLVAQLASGANESFEYRTVAFDGYSLEDHWNRGLARRAIAEGGWSIVVLQQGPSALPESRILLYDYTKRFDQEVRRVGARTALYMVWPARQRRGDFEAVRASYAGAARQIGAMFLPAGEAWRETWQRDSHIALYATDGVHPTITGSYLAALVMFEAFFERSPNGLPPLSLPPQQAKILQRAANAAYSSAIAK